MLPAYIEKIASTTFARRMAQFLVPHKHNNHHPYLIRHESLFILTFIILAVQFFSFQGVSSARVLGYGTDINKSTIISITNQERASQGLGPLKENSKLNQSSTLKAQDMFAKDYWSHFAPDGTSPWHFFKLVGYNYNWAGENLARDFSTSAGVVAGWMASQGHRDNMLNPNFSDIGIGIVNGTLEGDQTTLVVEHLGQTLGTSDSSTGTQKPTNNATTGEPVKIDDKFNQTESKAIEATAAADIKEVQERISEATTGAFNFPVFWKGLGFGQKTTIVLLGVLISLFLFDSFVIWRRGTLRHNSHSFLHAGVLAILMFTLIRGAMGGVL